MYKSFLPLDLGCGGWSQAHFLRFPRAQHLVQIRTKTEQAVVVIFSNIFGLLGPVHKKVWLQLTIFSS